MFNSNEYIFNNLYDYHSDYYSSTSIKSKYYLEEIGYGYLSTNRVYSYSKINLLGTDIYLFSFHLSYDTAENRKNEFQEILTITEIYNNVIIGIDSNIERKSELDIIESKYKCANGLYGNWLPTYFRNKEDYYLDNPTSALYLDNIFVKGNVDIDYVYVPNYYPFLSSDHLPIIARLSVLVNI